MKVVQLGNKNNLRDILARMVAIAGPDNCDDRIIMLLNDAVLLAEDMRQEKAPVRGHCSSYQPCSLGAVHHPGG